VKLLIDEDTASAALLTRLQAAGHEPIQLPPGTSDEAMFAEAQRLGIPILTANVGRKGRRDPVGLYRLALERTPHHGVIGIFRPEPRQWLSDQQIVAALNGLAQLEQAQPGTVLRRDGLTRLNDFLPPVNPATD
jgi:hypothetical protein